MLPQILKRESTMIVSDHFQVHTHLGTDHVQVHRHLGTDHYLAVKLKHGVCADAMFL